MLLATFSGLLGLKVWLNALCKHQQVDQYASHRVTVYLELIEEVGHVRDQILNDKHVWERIDLDRLAQIGVDWTASV